MAAQQRKQIRTSTLLRRLFNAPTIEGFLDQSESSLDPPPFHTCLMDLCSSRGEIPERVIVRSGIERTYGHQLFNGTRNPSRDKVIQLAFGFALDVEETQSLLQAARKSTLYPKVKRDAAIIFCLHHQQDFFEAQAVLHSLGLTGLGED